MTVETQEQTFTDENADQAEEQAPQAEQRPHEGKMAEKVGTLGITLMIVYFILLTLLLLYTVIRVWPVVQPDGEVSNQVRFLTWEISLADEIRLLIIVVLAGALGSCVHVIRSLSDYIGNRLLVWSWLPMYILRPFAGSILALVIYLVVRGGFFSGAADIQDTSAFGFAAVSALAGMFSEEAVLKLKELAERLFSRKEPGKDALETEDRAATEDNQEQQ